MAYDNLAHLDTESPRCRLGNRAGAACDPAGRASWRHDEFLAHALTTLGLGAPHQRRSRQVGPTSSAACNSRWRTAPRSEVARAYTNLCSMAISRRQYAQAGSLTWPTGLAYCEERDLDSWWLYMIAGRARMRFEQSDWDRASDDVDAVLRHPRTTPITRIPVAGGSRAPAPPAR